MHYVGILTFFLLLLLLCFTLISFASTWPWSHFDYVFFTMKWLYLEKKLNTQFKKTLQNVETKQLNGEKPLVHGHWLKQNGEHAQGEIKRKGLEMAVLGEKSVVNQAKGENRKWKRREEKRREKRKERKGAGKWRNKYREPRRSR